MSAWNHYASIDKDIYGIKQPSIPLIYQGDYHKYHESVLKIITAGLNPPANEFPDYNPALRHKELHKYINKTNLTQYEATQYLDSLNLYFTRNSNSWFENIEPVLNGVNASYYGGTESTVLHTELLTPLSTVESWSKYLDKYPTYVIEDVITKGHSLWLELMNLLQPDIIITSLGAKYRRNIFNIQKLNWVKIDTITTNTKGDTRKRPYEIYCSIATLDNGKKCMLIFGDRSVVPFMINLEQKLQLGSKILRLMSKIYKERKPQRIQNHPEEQREPLASIQK